MKEGAEVGFVPSPARLDRLRTAQMQSKSSTSTGPGAKGTPGGVNAQTSQTGSAGAGQSGQGQLGGGGMTPPTARQADAQQMQDGQALAEESGDSALATTRNGTRSPTTPTSTSGTALISPAKDRRKAFFRKVFLFFSANHIYFS